MPPLALALMIAAPFVIGLAYLVQRAGLFRGYQAIAEDVQQIARSLNAKICRDGRDLVVAGTCEKLPVIIRFSDDESRPQFRVQMRARMSFSLSLQPQKETSDRRQNVIRTGSYLLDSKFTVISSQPTQAKMLFHDTASLAALNKLCYSKQIEFAIAPGEMELVEPAVPTHVGPRVAESLQSMLAIARFGEQVPGAEKIELVPMSGNRPNWTFRAVVATGVLVGIYLLWIGPEQSPMVAYQASASVKATSIPGMGPLDAAAIHRLESWHVASAEDFSDPARQFFEKYSLEPSGRVSAGFSGKDTVSDNAYLLVNAQGKRRVSMLADGAVVFDQIFDQLPLIASVPKNKFSSLTWVSAPTATPDGDLLLVVYDLNDPAANVVLFRSGNQTMSGALEDFKTVNLNP